MKETQLPFIPEKQVKEARALAKDIVENVYEDIVSSTTVGIERCVARFLGVEGANSEGAPLVNKLVDDGLKKGALSDGIAYHIGNALLHHKIESPLALATKYCEKEFPVFDIPKSPLGEVETFLDPFVKAGQDRMKESLAKRQDFKNQVKPSQGPWKYLIVATGNIEEDGVQARIAAEQGADIIAIIRSTAQSLLDYVPYGKTTVGFGGTYATQENFRYIREILDQAGEELGRYIHLVNYSSGLCMAEIAYLGAVEGLDMVLNDAMYGILFRDINMRRTLIDQYISRLICAHNDMYINTGEDNYLTTSDAMEVGYQVVTSQLINEQFALKAGMNENRMGLGHAFEIDPAMEDSFVNEMAGALLVRQLFPKSPLKYMPPTRYMTGDVFQGFLHNGFFNLTALLTEQDIVLLGMMTEQIHTPFAMDRALAIQNADYVFRTAKTLKNEISFKSDGKIKDRMQFLMDHAIFQLKEIKEKGLYEAIADASFAGISRTREGGKGLEGVVLKNNEYYNPMLSFLEE